MEIGSQSLDSSKELKHYPLTPFRIVRGLICLAVYLATASMFLVYFVPPAMLVRLFSVHYSRKMSSYLFGMWLGLWPFLFEKINGTKVTFSGDRIPVEERVLIIANHRTEVDWMYMWDLAIRKGCLGYLKYVLKRSLMKLPIFGWGFHILEFIPVHRNWEVDEPVMREMLSTFSDRRDPLWLAVFPEGTDYTKEKCAKSQKFANENGLPVLKNVLLPKTRGFNACLEILRGSLDAVYDVTIAYKNRLPTFLDNVFGVDPSEVHMHIKRIPLDKIPLSEEESSAWLMNEFVLKDKLLTDFIVNGEFPDQGTERELSTAKCAANCAVVIAVTIVFTFLTFFSAVWFKLYVVLACLYLVCASSLNFRPSPLLDTFVGKKSL
ncbi:probable 1-acyl-sn-glycerol-3-phosphate acyltransferase 4 [Andrographis paniculata]|uniref:probable 1-acyl-sn-glycerol-3-phosphate acyltransferase 4 n=1 Tax=Andrographis paniculata TaxID=175694 RepID=UPI0021E7E34B|nr:probable 1-acyl-sn-glycerol-3-phosphate acyltransferase 4 [Andrographis paniculata]